MASPSNRAQETREHRLSRLHNKLRQLDQSAPNFKRERDLLSREIQLVAGERTGVRGPSRAAGPSNRATATTTARKSGTSAAKRTSGTATGAGTRKKGTARAKGKGLSTEALGGLGKALSPKNIEESLGSIVSLRSFCKQCMKYVQQADTLLDTLFVTGNSLKESGVLSKLAESKGKNLNTSDFTNILMALMNSPMGNNIFKKLGSGDGEAASDGSAESTVTPAASQAATASAIVTRPARVPSAVQQPGRPLPPGVGHPPL
ncbi:MAG: hypothetical protein OWT28_11420 [Firmicutes bacterium]|nr:hypothetical protein [Bacillota bacterium]